MILEIDYFLPIYSEWTTGLEILLRILIKPLSRWENSFYAPLVPVQGSYKLMRREDFTTRQNARNVGAS